jgi:cyclic pyranopterin phosphate synthase
MRPRHRASMVGPGANLAGQRSGNTRGRLAFEARQAHERRARRLTVRGRERRYGRVQRHLPIVGSRVARLEQAPPRPRGFGEPSLPKMVDARGREYTYLRVSITDRCNLACVYCMPAGGEIEHAHRPELLAFEEIVRLVSVLAESGVRRVRFTGGEPLVRRDVVRLVEMVGRTSAEELVMTTNAVRLAELAEPLRRAGLHGVNVSIDSLDPDRFRVITRGGELGPVLAGVHAALEAGLEVKINCVALGGENDHELGALVDWAWGLGITPRFIELMPIGEGASLPAERFMSADDIVRALGDRVDGALDRGDSGKGPARYLNGISGRVGLITAVSDEFCASCNRVRITAKGDLRACLADRRAVSLRDLMREGASDADIAWAVGWSLGAKDAGHKFEDHAAEEHTHVGMSLIGG